MLKFFGHDISIPVTALDQIKASGVFADSEVPSERHTPTMLLWTKFMQLHAQNENPERPNFGPKDVNTVLEKAGESERKNWQVPMQQLQIDTNIILNKQREAARNTIQTVSEKRELLNTLYDNFFIDDKFHHRRPLHDTTYGDYHFRST